MPTAITCPGPVACLAAIFRLLLAGFMDRAPAVFPPGALVDAVWRRIHRLGARLRWVATTTGPRAAPSRPRATLTRPRRAPDLLTTWRVTHQHGWLTTMMPGIDQAAEAFDAFLRTSGPDDLLDADPRYADLLFRLGRMLGVAEELLPPPHWPDPPTEPLDPAEPRPAPRGYSRTDRVNQLGFDLLQARQRAAADPPPDPDIKFA